MRFATLLIILAGLDLSRCAVGPRTHRARAGQHRAAGAETRRASPVLLGLITLAGLGAGSIMAAAPMPAAVAAAPADALADEARKACFEGRWLLVQNRLDEAESRLELALSLSPDYAEAKDLLAQVQGRLVDTNKHCDQAAALAKQAKWDDAVQEVQWALMTYAGSARAKAMLADVKRQAAEATVKSGAALAAAGNFAAAEADLRRSLEFVPDQAPAREALARLDAQRGRLAAEQRRPGAAYLWFSEAAELAPKNAEYQAQAGAARVAAVERLRFAVVQDRPQGGPGAAEFSDAAWKCAAAAKPDFLAILPAPGAAGAAFTVGVDLGPIDVRTGPPRVEARTFAYKANVESPNPDYTRMNDQLSAARDSLSILQANDQRVCQYCGGLGWIRCRYCNGTGIRMMGTAPGGTSTCPYCGGSGRLVCVYCGGRGYGSPNIDRDISQTQRDVTTLQTALSRTPATVTRQVAADYPYTVDLVEKTGALEATVRVTSGPGGPAAAEAVRQTRRFESATIRNPRPEIGLKDAAQPLPADDEVRRVLAAEGASEAGGKILSAVLGTRAAGLQAASQRALAESKVAPAVEMGVDASVIRESLNKAEASRLQAALRERMRIEEKAAASLPVPPPPRPAASAP